MMRKATEGLPRPELAEMRSTIKSLKREAELRQSIEMEAQQSFEFLSDQVHGLRRAFSTLSEVLIEEVDLLRSEASTRQAELHHQLAAQAKALKASKTEVALLRSEAQAGRASLTAKAAALDERVDGMQEDLKEVAKGSSAQHLLQLEMVELRSHLEAEQRARQAAQEGFEARLAQLTERLDAHAEDARGSMQALDADVSGLRGSTELELESHASCIESNKAKLLQCAQAIEKQWSAGKAQQQRLDALSANASSHTQQLQERLEGLSKHNSRWRGSMEEAMKTLSGDSQLLQAHCRSLDTALSTCRADAGRLVTELEAATQRQCDTLGRAIHSLADTLNLTSPLGATWSMSTT